ncbi:MAG: ABC transporter permease subunit [Candidatus Acidiferrales bacterium]
MNNLIAAVDTALLLGLCFSGIAMGLVVSLRFLNYPDLTIEGSVPFGAAVSALVLLRTGSLPLALATGFIGGGVAGLLTACLHVFLGVGKLLSGILMISVLYSISLHVLGGSNLSLLQTSGSLARIESVDRRWSDSVGVSVDPLKIGLLLLLMGILMSLLIFFFSTKVGIAIRALGDNETLLPAFGRDPRPFKFLALALANALAGLAGGLVAMNQGFADVGMGQGGLVLGLAGLILGEQSIGRILGNRRLVVALVTAAVFGSVLYQAALLLSFRIGVSASDVKLLTAVLVLSAIVLARGDSVFYRGRTF